MTSEELTDLMAVAAIWNLAQGSAPPDMNGFLEALAAKVAELLRRDRRKFMNDLYRLDVSEERVERVFRAASPREQPKLLAQLILERELKKAATRREAENKKT